MKLRVWLAAAAISLAGYTAEASVFSNPFSSFWALGDSLTDNGNLFAFDPSAIPSPPYFAGRVSSGPTFAEYLAADFVAQGKPVGNLAFAGARAITNDDLIPDLSAQAFAPVPIFADGKPGLIGRAAEFGDRPLVSLFFGSNDVLSAFTAEQDPVAAASAAADAVLGAIAGLSLFGIHDFLVLGLPDFAGIPRLNTAPVEVRAVASFAAQTFDLAVANGVAGLPSGVRVTQINTSSALANMIENPAPLGIVNTTEACLLVGCINPGQFAFFDDIHPSGTVHEALADVVRSAYVAPIPLPAAGWALLMALAGLGVMGRRRSA